MVGVVLKYRTGYLWMCVVLKICLERHTKHRVAHFGTTDLVLTVAPLDGPSL